MFLELEYLLDCVYISHVIIIGIFSFHLKHGFEYIYLSSVSLQEQNHLKLLPSFWPRNIVASMSFLVNLDIHLVSSHRIMYYSNKFILEAHPGRNSLSGKIMGHEKRLDNI